MADESDNPILLKNAAELRAEQEAKDKRRDRRQRQLQLWFNGILTVMTIVTAGVVLYQNRILNRTLSEIERQSKAAESQISIGRNALGLSELTSQASLAQGQEALNLSSRSFDAQVSAFRSEQRAWVMFQQLQANWTIGKPVEFTVKWINSGKTPASTVLAVVRGQGIDLRDHPDRPALTYPTKPQLPLMLTPNGTIDSRIQLKDEKEVPWTLNQTHIDLINRGKGRVYLYGRLDYVDAFDCEHWTQFCVRIKSYTDGQLLWEPCGQYDGVDQGDCKQRKK